MNINFQGKQKYYILGDYKIARPENTFLLKIRFIKNKR